MLCLGQKSQIFEGQARRNTKRIPDRPSQSKDKVNFGFSAEFLDLIRMNMNWISSTGPRYSRCDCESLFTG